MQPTLMGVRKRTALPDAARADRIASHLRRYGAPFRSHVCALAESHPRLADLAMSFPALLFALAAPRPGFDPARAIARVIAGACLADIAAAAEVPMWLRKLPPETFVRRLGVLPDGALFRRRIANHLPGTAKLAPTWLQAVADTAAYADERVATWVARELLRAPKAVNLDRLRARRRLCLVFQPAGYACPRADRSALATPHALHERPTPRPRLGGRADRPASQSR